MKSVGILGATGAVGSEAIEALEGHPWFTVSHVFASERSAGNRLADRAAVPVPAYAADKVIELVDPSSIPPDVDVFFSALPNDEPDRLAATLEPLYASRVGVMSTTSAFRYHDDVPILITEVNPEHAELLRVQQKRRGWKGWIAPEPNCTTVGLVMSLKPIYDAAGIRRVFMASYQAVSGGGADKVRMWREERRGMPELPDVMSREFIEHPELVFDGNVITEIPGEEAKVMAETLKILGRYKDGAIVPADFGIDCLCARVPTLKGHMEAVFVETANLVHPTTSGICLGHLMSNAGRGLEICQQAPCKHCTFWTEDPRQDTMPAWITEWLLL